MEPPVKTNQGEIEEPEPRSDEVKPPVRFDLSDTERKPYTDDELLEFWDRLPITVPERERLVGLLMDRRRFGLDLTGMLEAINRKFEREGARIRSTSTRPSAIRKALDPTGEDDRAVAYADAIEQDIRSLYPEVLKAIGKTPSESDAGKLAEQFGRTDTERRKIRSVCEGERLSAKDLTRAIVRVCIPESAHISTEDGWRRLIPSPGNPSKKASG